MCCLSWATEVKEALRSDLLDRMENQILPQRRKASRVVSRRLWTSTSTGGADVARLLVPVISAALCYGYECGGTCSKEDS